MPTHLLLSVHLHDRRYHGAGDWPPSPARVFQALVAGAARGGPLAEADVEALGWLERLGPPIIAAPHAKRGSAVNVFVPNNDLDAVGGDPRRVEEIRARKRVHPRLLDEGTISYAWATDDAGESASRICAIADNLYQLGRGVDMAWATARLVDEEALDAFLRAHRGPIHRPGGDPRSAALACPTPGSLASLMARHEASQTRLQRDPANPAQQLFRQPPKARFTHVAYGAPANAAVFELRSATEESRIATWPLRRAVTLVERIRDAVAERLRAALPGEKSVIERSLVGRKADGADAAPTEQRVRITPLPSIGHEHADRAIRRLLVEIPPTCPLAAEDVLWAFSGLEPVDPSTGAVDLMVVATADQGMLGHFRAPSRLLRTVTAAALPLRAARRRIDPARQHDEAKPAPERVGEERHAVEAVKAALRHAGVVPRAVSIRVQREPLDPHGARAEAFAPETRFAKERLWHVEVELDEPVSGPVVIGDGRFLGLGVMAPAPAADDHGILAFEVEGGFDPQASSEGLARAFRRAVMARVGEAHGGTVSAYVAGHAPDGSPARAEVQAHLAFHVDPGGRLLVVPPHALLHRAAWRHERDEITRVDVALRDLRELRAGHAGRFVLRSGRLDAADPLVAPSTSWESVTPYAVERHVRAESATDMVVADVTRACERSGLPRPRVAVTEVRSERGRGVFARVRLEFAVACAGPIALGRTRHLGGGLFRGVGG